MLSSSESSSSSRESWNTKSSHLNALPTTWSRTTMKIRSLLKADTNIKVVKMKAGSKSRSLHIHTLLGTSSRRVSTSVQKTVLVCTVRCSQWLKSTVWHLISAVRSSRPRRLWPDANGWHQSSVTVVTSVCVGSSICYKGFSPTLAYFSASSLTSLGTNSCRPFVTVREHMSPWQPQH